MIDEQDSEKWLRVERIYGEALDLAGEERVAFLIRSCGGDLELLEQVERLIRAYENNPNFMETPLEIQLGQPSFELTERRLGAYRLVRKLGSGGMGVVYLGERDDGAFRLKVAIKIVWPASPIPDLVRRFNRERQILANLNHPKISRLIDAGTTSEGLPFMVMEYIEGERIDNYCEEKQLRLADRLGLLIQAAEAVQYAHKHQVVHRDIKPGNILVTPAGEVKLLDFGIARVLESDEGGDGTQHSGVQLMTYDYASPEQVKGEPVGEASDIYALGVVLYRLIAGRLPYRLSRVSPLSVINSISGEQPAEIEEFGTPAEREMIGQLNQLLRRALAKLPNERYPTVGELVADVRTILAGGSIIPNPVVPDQVAPVDPALPVMESAERRGVKRRLWVAAGVIGAIVVIVATLLFAARSSNTPKVDLVDGYVSAIESATRELNAGRHPEALKALREIPDQAPGGGKLRGFEWAYLMKQASRPQVFNHEHEVRKSILTSNQRYLVTTTSDSSEVTVWDTSNNLKPIKVVTGKDVWARTMIDPNAALRADVNSDSLEVEDLLSAAPPLTCRYEKGGLNGVFLKDGLHTIENDGSIRKWDIGNCRSELVTRIRPLNGGVFEHPYPLPLGMVQMESSVTIWNLKTGQMLIRIDDDRPNRGKKNQILVIDKRGEYAAFAWDKDKPEILVYDLRSRARILRYKSPEAIEAMRIDAVGHRFMLVGKRGQTSIHALSDGRLCGNLASSITDIISLDDGRMMIAATSDGQIQTIDGGTGNQVSTMRAHPPDAEVYLQISADGEKLITSGSDGSSRIWSISELLAEAPLRLEHSGWFNSISLSPDDKLVASGSSNGQINIWETASRRQLRVIPTGSTEVLSVAFSPSGEQILSTGDGENATIWNVSDGRPLLRMRHDIRVHIGIYSPNGKMIATGGADKLIRIWETSTGRLLKSLRGHDNEVTSLVFLGDEGRLVSGGYDETLRLWDTNSGAEIGRLAGQKGIIWDVAVSPDGKRLATIGEDSVVRLHQIETRSLISTIDISRNGGMGVAFNPAEHRIAVADKNKKVFIHDSTSGRKILQLSDFAGDCTSIAFTRDGKTLVTGDLGGQVRMFAIR